MVNKSGDNGIVIDTAVVETVKRNPSASPKKRRKRVAAKKTTVCSRVMSAEEETLMLEKELIERKGRFDNYKSTHKAEFATFLPHQQKVLDFIQAEKKTVLMVTGNRGGKTTVGAIITAAICVPYLREKLGVEFFNEKFPVKNGRIRILCKDWEHHAGQVIVPALKEWLPLGSYDTKKNNVGVEAFWTFKSGWTIELMTNVQDTAIHEGWKGHFVWQDETTTRDKYVANKRGLIDYSGIYLMTFTAVDVSWVLDDIVLSQEPTIGCITGVSTYENTYLAREDVETYEKTLTDTEKIARIGGNFLNLEGRVWKVFDHDIHVVDDFKVPPDWPVVFQIDFHLSLPHAISFMTVNPYGQRFICGEIWQNMDSMELADEIVRMKTINVWRLKEGEIDALSKGDSSYVKNRMGRTEDSYTVIERKLRMNGIRLGVGSKDEKSYVKSVEGWFKGVNGPPLLFVMRSCKETIRQIDRWTYDDSGHPRDDGHFPECIGRFSQMGVKYTNLYLQSAPIRQVELNLV